MWNSVEDADESGRWLCTQSEELTAKRFETWKFRQYSDLFLSQHLFVKDAGFYVDFLLFLEERTKCLSDSGWVITTDDDRSLTSQVLTEIREVLGCGCDTENAVFNNVELSIVLCKRGTQFCDFFHGDTLVISEVYVIGLVEVLVHHFNEILFFWSHVMSVSLSSC